jgi:KDO2-lipid IV(A) lauroyltransferase
VFSRILYYGIIKPLSLLPWSFLYVLSDMLYLVLYHAGAYRKKVVMQNLRNAFPDLEESERVKIARRFYAHLSDLIAEGIKMFSAPATHLQERMRCVNPEIPLRILSRHTRVIIAGGHYNNWEMCGVASPFYLSPYPTISIFKPLSDAFMNKKLQQMRSRFGMQLVAMDEIKKIFSCEQPATVAIFFVIDQSPSNPSRGYWTSFLNQDTCFMTGAARYAIRDQLPVVFARIEKVKRGYYTVSFEEVPVAGLTIEQIMEQLIRRLEQQILSQPEYWLWSHRRWKHKRPVV